MKKLKQNLTKGEKDMKQRLNGAVLALKQNKGATIVTVLVSMFFLLTLTSIMVFMSFTALRIEQTEAVGIRGFYDGEALMDEIKVGMEKTMSDTLVEAYQTVFSGTTKGDTVSFMLKTLEGITSPRNFVDQMGQNADGSPRYFYNTEFLRDFLLLDGVSASDIYIENLDNVDPDIISTIPIHLSGDMGVTVPGHAVPGFQNYGLLEYDENSMTFKGISVIYTDPETQIRTEITSDIVLSLPDEYFTSMAQAIGFSNAVDFCLIATENIITRPAEFDGGVYANKFSTTTAGTTTIHETLIARESLDISISNNLYINSIAEVWAGDITLDNLATITSEDDSSIFIQNDLSLDGEGAKAEINGSLLGFGDSTTNPDESSSILLNGINTELDLSNTDFLMLAGHSFIMANEGGTLMGESISARPNQLAYLAPISILGNPEIVSNPLIITTPTNPSHFPDISGLNKNTAIIGANSLNSYNADILQLTYPLAGTGQSAVYYFITFNDTDDANRYFIDYFGANSSEITGYLADYSKLSTVGGIPQVSGNYIIENGPDTFSLGNSDPIATESAEFVKQAFDNMVKNLSLASTNATDPYKYLIDIGEIKNFTNQNASVNNIWEFTDSSGEVVALFADTDLTFDNIKYPYVKLVVSTGEVTLNQNFAGMIISNQNINISSGATNISSDSTGVVSAFSATYDDGTLDGTPISELFTIAGAASIGGTVEQSEIRDITDMVTYANWTKN